MSTLYLRHRWSHDAWFHRTSVKIFNCIMGRVPFCLKYGVGRQLRQGRPPYSLVKEGSVVVQVGAPLDTLKAGRSRAMYFSLFAGSSGKVVIVEPDQKSIECLETLAERRGIRNMALCPLAAWSENKVLKVFVSDSHPASSFTEGTKKYSANRMKDFHAVEIPADTVDNLLKEMGISRVDLISITTNGAEEQILAGASRTIRAGLPYIALARTGEKYDRMMAALGYDFFGYDDRGFTFARRVETEGGLPNISR
jgi:FkbM family methyltransferase